MGGLDMDSSLSRALSFSIFAAILSACGGGASPPFTPEEDTGTPTEDGTADILDATKDGDESGLDASETSDGPGIETTADAIDADLPCDAPIKCFVDGDGDGYARSDGSIVACA